MNDNTSFDMNNTNKTDNNDSVPKYQATANYNTMLNSGVNISNNNPNNDVNVNGILGNNLDKNDIVMPSYNTEQQNIQNITMPEYAAPADNTNKVDEVQLHDTTNSINDRVIAKKTKKSQFKINKDVLSIYLIALILFIVIMLSPTIFELFDNLKNKIVG